MYARGLAPVAARDRRIPVVLGIVLAVGLALRVAYILGQRGDLLFDHPVVDEELYVALGRAMADGHPPDPRAWFHPPGLVYVLATVFRAAGPGLLAPRLVQAVVSTAACGLAYVVGARLFSPRVGVATAAVCALHGVLVFESYELLPPTWMLATDLLALWLLLRALDLRTPLSAALAGGALGVAAVFGPTVLPFALFAAAWLGWLRRPALVAAFALGVALPIAPVTWGNWERGHEVVLVSTNGGLNFFVGNNEHYDETLAIRPGEHWEYFEQQPLRAGVVDAGAQSSWFYARGRAFWREHPARAVALTLRKLYLYLDGPEIPRDTDVYTVRGDSALLRALVTRGPPWLPDGLLVPLALVGAAACWPDRRRLAPVYAFVALQALVVAAFFATSRYRVPAIPALAVLACGGVARLAAASRASRGLAAAGFVVLGIALNVATRESSVSYVAETDFYRGLALMRYLHRSGPAAEYFRRAASEDPADGRIWFELGNALDAAGRTGEALDAWRSAARADPWDARSLRRVSVVLARRGDLGGAIAALEANVASRARPEAFYATDHLNMALLYARGGRDDRAVQELHASATADPAWFRSNLPAFARSVMADPGLGPAFRDAVAAAGGAGPGG